MLNLLENLIIEFKSKENLVTLIIEHNEKLLEFMLNNELANEYKKHFFKEISNTLIFNDKALLECLETRELNHSYTRFKNKIGLFLHNNFIKNSEKVVLNFPFKDNVLLGNAKDNDTKSNELFYHEILHKNEIDTLLNQKVLENFEMHGEHEKGDLENALKDKNTNYLIKGNNLIALHSLKKKFAKQVKCIYIDPPYNTGNDSFNYNDNFNHSTWLVFMKNRLEIAREFLKDDGVIFVNLDDHEVHYCKVLMDEIFGVKNFIGDFIRKTKSTTNDAKIGINYQHEFLLCYAKNKEFVNLLGGQKNLENYKNPDNDPNGAWISDNPSAKSGNMKTGYFAVTNPYTNKVDYPPVGMFWRFSQNTIQKHIDEGRICFKKEYKDNERGFIYKRYLKDLKTTQKTFDSLEFTDNLYMNQVATKELIPLGFAEVFKNAKPESLIATILEHATNENDLVLDFFAGSGTTCAVAHKMKRRYIGIEQMDYIESITKERLKKVIDGELGGISKKLDFKGGGSFIYCELKEVNLQIKKQILNAKNTSECLEIFNALNKRILKRADCDIHALNKEEFKTLSLEQQKEICCELLDFNEDYLNLGDIDEDTWEIDENTRKYNEIFYKK
ncbi:site-specific DNA-methyltransferase [Helicobacter cetorum]|uniref:site-specific DNA-methyltransferase n=1 Tax=Helicobacter cetorum TaxID=138563 RepID=UPI000CF14B32|nr:site-specific DNA-methyltransferase [Helicobacter cetorum]